VFAAIGRMVVEGDAYVSHLAVIGYLEGMQMVTVTSAGLDPEADSAVLQPNPRRVVGAVEPALGRRYDGAHRP
jgi:hypothetical protein